MMRKTLKRQAKDYLKRMMASAFHLGQRFGFDVLPRSFYSEIPVVWRLRQTEHWREPFSMIAVEGADAAEQLEFLRQTIGEMPDSANRATSVFAHACQQNGAVGYGPIDTSVLYAFVAAKRPPKIVQVGCGVSTAICLAAAGDAGYVPQVVCIEPYPTPFLYTARDEGKIELIEEPVELLDIRCLVDLPANGLLFFDSTHTLGPAGEVSRLILEVLPRVPADVWVHFHDIWFPYDYAPHILDSAIFFWHESAMLHAFLVNNRRFRIAASLSMLHHAKQAELQALILDYKPSINSRGIMIRAGHYPSAIYLRVSSPHP